jgi:hypothetical protein
MRIGVRVLVTYPGGNVYYRNELIHNAPERKMNAIYHGATIKNPNHFIVEDDSGWIHVVNKDIVTEVV